MIEITIFDKMFQKYTVREGIEEVTYSTGFEAKVRLDVEKVTREDVLEKVCELTFSTLSEYTTEDLFDGNETFFTFSRLEDADANELLNQGVDGYYATYMIAVNEVKEVLISSIPEKTLPVRFHYDGKISEEMLNNNYRVGEGLMFRGHYYSIMGIINSSELKVQDKSNPYMAVYLAITNN